MTRKEMPLVLMLSAGSITALLAYFRGFNLSSMLIALLATLIFFYVIGCIIKMVLDSFDKKNEKKEEVAPEGEVIEKEPEAEGDAINSENP